ncbi:MAG TPA: hypothetical protein VN683_02125 [Acidothermaceae bacterium]|nr:hypothetical protein [Acidothermaceae bacterium]
MIEPALRSIQVVDNWQLVVGIADADNSPHNSVADNHPVDVSSRTLHADVIQSSEALAAEKVDLAQIQHELF